MVINHRNELLLGTVTHFVGATEQAKCYFGPFEQADQYFSDVIFGGFPWNCFDNLCTTPNDCIMNGCVKGYVE
jgi:hypothetical protein